MAEQQFLSRWFGVAASGSTVPRELVAGLTTFGAMSYIVAVNPLILGAAGMDRGDLIAATVIASAVGSLAMGLVARLPVALAPGMGSNIVFAQGVVVGMGLSYPTALTMVLAGALLMLLLSVSRWRERAVTGLPASLRVGIQCAMGLFIAGLGLKSGGLVVVQHGAVALGNLGDPAVCLTLLGVLVTPVLLALRVPAALLFSIVSLTALSFWWPAHDGRPIASLPEHLAAWPRLPTSLWLAFDLHDFVSNVWRVLPITLYFFLSDFFSATATLVAVTRRGGLMTPEGDIPNARRAYAVDALASVAGAAVGTSTVVAYLESAAGIEAGGRTGLTAVTVAVLFGLAWCLWPAIAAVPPQATAPALVAVGLLMLDGLRSLDFTSIEHSMPPLLTMLVTVVASDFMAGMAVGLLSFTLLAAGLRRWQALTPALCLLDAVFVLYLALARSIA